MGFAHAWLTSTLVRSDVLVSQPLGCLSSCCPCMLVHAKRGSCTHHHHMRALSLKAHAKAHAAVKGSPEPDSKTPRRRRREAQFAKDFGEWAVLSNVSSMYNYLLQQDVAHLHVLLQEGRLTLRVSRSQAFLKVAKRRQKLDLLLQEGIA